MTLKDIIYLMPHDSGIRINFYHEKARIYACIENVPLTLYNLKIIKIKVTMGMIAVLLEVKKE